jgi:simple sugar transport system permease protein
LFGALLVGANKLQRAVQVPAALITALNGLVVVFVVSSEIWRKRRARQRVTFVEDDGDLDVVMETAVSKTTGESA